MKDAAGGNMVESPGTAPGSDPLITSAFMFIVPKDVPDIVVLRDICNMVRRGSLQSPSGETG